MKSRLIIFLLAAVMLAGLTACGKKAADENTEASRTTAADTESADAKSADAKSEETESADAESTGTESTDTENACSAEMQQVIDAIEGVSNQSAFGIDTDAHLKLNGKAIQGDYNMHTEVHVTQKENHEDMEMTMETSSDMDDIVTYTSYKDGWYCVDGTDGLQKEEKTPEEVLSLISGVTDLVKESAGKIDEVDVENADGYSVCTYELPSWLAENYLKQLVDATKIDDISGAQIKIEHAVLTSTIEDATGLLTRQEVQITGTVHKAIFTVPAEAEITADFLKE